jgi:hypothetical protein
MITLLPKEIIQDILSIDDFPSLSRTCHHFNNLTLIPKFEKNQLIYLPKFILTEKWAKSLWNQKDGRFMIPQKFKNDELDIPNLFSRLICNNSLYAVKMVFKQLRPRPNDTELLNIDIAKECFKTNQDYLVFCEAEGLNFKDGQIYAIRHSFLILTYLFGTKEMLKYLLDTFVIENIDFTADYITNMKNNKSIMELVNKYDLKNNWDMKFEVYKKVSFEKLIEAIRFGNKMTSYLDNDSAANYVWQNVKKILDRYEKSFYDADMVVSLIPEMIPKIKIIPGMKIKHQLAYISSNSKNKYLVDLIFNYFEWSDTDFEIIDKMILKINLLNLPKK